MNNAHVVSFLRQLVAEIPWGQNLLILNKLTDPAARLWHLQATARLGWTRNVLLNPIKAGAYERAVTEKKAHNFDLALTLGKEYEGLLIERPYLRVANVQEGYLDLEDVTTIEVPAKVAAGVELRPGDVLMTEGGEFPIPLPSVREQERLVELLDSRLCQLQGTQRALETQIVTLTGYRKSLIHECVTGQRRITD